jgi:hypothetical protein
MACVLPDVVADACFLPVTGLIHPVCDVIVTDAILKMKQRR